MVLTDANQPIFNMITNITINNIKGFGESNNSFALQIKPSKVNILVAPNGFGKSSITAAFSSLKSSKLELDELNYHNNDRTLKPVLSITEDGEVYTANDEVNNISKTFNIFSVKNMVKAYAKSKNFGGYVNTKGVLGIDDIIVIKNIPPIESLEYSVSDLKKEFGKNGKVLSNIEYILKNCQFLAELKLVYLRIGKLLGKKNQAKLQCIVTSINSKQGTSEQIKSQITEQELAFLNEEPFRMIYNLIAKCSHLNKIVDNFLVLYQIVRVYEKNKSVFKRYINRKAYELFKAELTEIINDMGATWKRIRPTEHKNSLIVKFPLATEISYGQRDILILAITFQVIKKEISSVKKNIVIIDEVFDYLDAVNLTITQYYLSDLINSLKDKCDIYTIIMTHLNPEYFKNFVFSDKMMNIQNLLNFEAIPYTKTKRLLSKRSDASIQEDVDCYLLHYSPINKINKRVEFKALSLPELWGEGDKFKNYLVDEINKYFSNTSNFDPYAICIATRIRVEKLAYDKLNSGDQDKFIETHKTTEKLKFAESVGVDIPDIFYLLGIIYNDGCHMNRSETDKPIIYRLNHIGIKNLIRKLFDNQNEISINHLY